MKTNIEHACVAPVKLKFKKARTESYGKREKVEMICELRFIYNNSHHIESITEKNALKVYNQLKKWFGSAN